MVEPWRESSGRAFPSGLVDGSGTVCNVDYSYSAMRVTLIAANRECIIHIDSVQMLVM